MTVLMVSAGMVPFDTCTKIRSITMLYEGTAHSVLDTDRVVRSPSQDWIVPSVLRVPSRKFVPIREANFTRLNVMYRDDQTCQWCGAGPLPVSKLQLEHVIPESRFDKIAAKRGLKYGKTSWLNCVASCIQCNQMKRDRLPEELGWHLIRKPFIPKYRPYLMVSRKEADAYGWTPFLEPFVPTFVRLY